MPISSSTPMLPEDAKHEELYDKALEAITNVFNDNTVSPIRTRESLVDLKSEIQTFLDALDVDDPEEGSTEITDFDPDDPDGVGWPA